ncbi:response regulator transcription factor [Streptomyces lasalocidi]|uniref:Response regulator transcription factor n=1 Tax=Streptomyces lasalocidi TaxID=324833 RepID=A0A4U5WBD5_STRLS|nr:response regulator transcription factor [Streptomyces lasalocidi]TKS99024.1 response regulator transcription factor [Streptomyces lasalocidi]
MRVLLVEDEEDLRHVISAGLRDAGYAVDTASDWPEADVMLDLVSYSCVVLDRIVPSGDTLLPLQERRRRGWTTPVLCLTALNEVADRVDGFHSGADDYLAKPFAMVELVLRVGSLVRRAPERLPVVLRYTDIELDEVRREVRRAGVLLYPTPKEYAVLHHLLLHPDEVVTRTALIEHCWDEMADPVSNVVDAVMAGLRRKLGEPALIRTVRGHGFRLTDRADPS